MAVETFDYNKGQKIDYLFKKINKKVKTDTEIFKSLNNERLNSKLLILSEEVWVDVVPNTPPTINTDTVIIVNSLELTKDQFSQHLRTWNTNIEDWIPPFFNSNYLVQIFVGSTFETSTRIFQDGSGNKDEWFFDYESGVLNFIGENLPNILNANSKIFIKGYYFIGEKLNDVVNRFETELINLDNRLDIAENNIIILDNRLDIAEPKITSLETRMTKVENDAQIEPVINNTPNRTLNTFFTPSVNHTTYVQYSIESSVTNTLAGNTSTIVNLQIGPNQSTLNNISTHRNTLNTTLSITIGLTKINTTTIQGFVPPNWVVRLQVQSGTATIINQQETKFPFANFDLPN